jgi:hypothetical protein
VLPSVTGTVSVFLSLMVVCSLDPFVFMISFRFTVAPTREIVHSSTALTLDPPRLFFSCIVKIWIDLGSSFSMYGSAGELLQRFPPPFHFFRLLLLLYLFDFLLSMTISMLRLAR